VSAGFPVVEVNWVVAVEVGATGYTVGVLRPECSDVVGGV